MAGVTSWSQARAAAYAAAEPLASVDLPLSEALGCVLAGPLWSLTPLPPFDTAAMDGWAVRGPGPWRVTGRVLAGQPVTAALAAGTAVEIATGAQVPGRTDGVLAYEEGATVGANVTGPAPRGRHVRRTGEECPARTALLPAGATLTPAALGLAAAVGHDALRVQPLPRVAALVTGDELLTAGLPGDGRVRDAVGLVLPGSVDGCGGRLVALEHLGDDSALLRTAIEDADADVLVTTGASSVGHADFLPGVLRELGAELIVDGVAVKPGHPQVLARLRDGRLLVGLPGNPLAALAGIVTMLAPVLAGLAGRRAPVTSRARCTQALAADPRSVQLVPARRRGELVLPTGHGGAAMLRGVAVADAFAVVQPGTDVDAGGEVQVVPLP